MTTNGKKDRLDRIEEMLEKTAELARMTSLQTAENAKQIAQTDKRLSAQISKMGKEHDREMKEIRVLFKQMIKRIAL